MNTILLNELKAIMALLEAMPRVPAPTPILPGKIDVPESETWDAFPYKNEEFAAWLEYGWEQIETKEYIECGPETPLYKFYIANHLYPKLLEAGYHYISGLRTEDDEAAHLLLKHQLLRLDLIYNIIGNIPGPEDIDVDELSDTFGPYVAEAMLSRIHGFVESIFNYDLLNARHIAFDYGERLRLYVYTEQGWEITQLGQAVRNLPDTEAGAFLLILETMHAMLDQDNWFVSRQRLQWLLDESPVRLNIYATGEEDPLAEELKKDDRWLRRLRWLAIATYVHDYTPYGGDITDFNSRTTEFTPSGQATAEAILASWDHKPGRPSIHSLVDSTQRLGLALSSQTTILEELGHIRKALGDLHFLIRTLQADFKEAQRSFEHQLSELEGEAQRDQAYQQAYEGLHQLVTRSLAQVDDRIREYELELVTQLGEVWDQLGADSQRFLSSAEYLYSEHRGANSLDFAPAAVEYCKVVETELGKRVSRPLLQYLREKVGPKVELKFGGRKCIVSTSANAKPPELGRLAHLLEASRTSKTNQVVRDFLTNHYPPDIQDLILQDLPAKLKQITTEYRNGAAHTEDLPQKKIEEFRAILLGSEDSLEPSLLQQITCIQPVPR